MTIKKNKPMTYNEAFADGMWGATDGSADYSDTATKAVEQLGKDIKILKGLLNPEDFSYDANAKMEIKNCVKDLPKRFNDVYKLFTNPEYNGKKFNR